MNSTALAILEHRNQSVLILAIMRVMCFIHCPCVQLGRSSRSSGSGAASSIAWYSAGTKPSKPSSSATGPASHSVSQPVSQQEPAHVQHTYVALANIGLLFLLVITLLVEHGYNELLQLEAKLMNLLHQLYCANRE